LEDYREQFEIVYVGPLRGKDPEYLGGIFLMDLRKKPGMD